MTNNNFAIIKYKQNGYIIVDEYLEGVFNCRFVFATEILNRLKNQFNEGSKLTIDELFEIVQTNAPILVVNDAESIDQTLGQLSFPISRMPRFDK